MRTATPISTCSWMTERSRSSATSESISTPRFIGPGCMISASGLATLSFSWSRPKKRKYSLIEGTNEPCMRSVCRRSIMTMSTSLRPVFML